MTWRPPLSRFLSVALACALGLAADSAFAKDLGVRGALWPIEEPDLLLEIETRLEAMKASGELARMRREALARARERVEAPGRVSGVVPARVRRTRLFDPSVRVERDVFAHDGNLIAARGARLNPLDTHPLTRDLLFIDGTRPVEVAWALSRERPSVIVLLAGRPLDLTRAHGRRFSSTRAGGSRGASGSSLHPRCLKPKDRFCGSRKSPWKMKRILKAKGIGHEAPDFYHSNHHRLRPLRRRDVRAVVHGSFREPRGGRVLGMPVPDIDRADPDGERRGRAGHAQPGLSDLFLRETDPQDRSLVRCLGAGAAG